MRNSATIVAMPEVASAAKAMRTTKSTDTATSSVPSIERSARRPPTALPMTRPIPNSTSSHGTAPLSKPLTSVSV